MHEGTIQAEMSEWASALGANHGVWLDSGGEGAHTLNKMLHFDWRHSARSSTSLVANRSGVRV
eukprot:350965-Chlamydomonas_euryale.AAC.1